MELSSSPCWRANNFDDCLNKFQGVAVKVCNCEVFMMFNARRLKMNRFTFSAFFVAAVLAGSFQNAKAQMINPTVQTTSPRVVASRSAPATAAKPVATARVAPRVAPRPTGLNPQRFNSICLARSRSHQPICSALMRRPSGIPILVLQR